MKHISNILSSSPSITRLPELHIIISHAQYLIKLNQQFKTLILPKDYAPHFDIMNLRENLLIIEANNSAWATRLKMLSPEILKKIASSPTFPNISKIKICVHPKAEKSDKPPKQNGLLLTKPAIQAIKSCAKNTSHPLLKAALFNFSNPSYNT